MQCMHRTFLFYSIWKFIIWSLAVVNSVLYLPHYLLLCKRSVQVEANVGAPQVNYRESISKVAEIQYVHKKQSGGSGQFADIIVRFEPLEAGSGYEFKSEIKGGAVPKEYVPGVMK